MLGSSTARRRFLVEKARQALRRNGVRTTLQKTGAWAWRGVAFSESHVWYELDLAGVRPAPQLPVELTLRLARERDLPLLTELPTIGPAEARARIVAGNDLWMVLDGDRLLFSCWIFRGRTPAIAAPGGQLPLPEGMVCLEDSFTAPPARGRGVAPAAWAAIAAVLTGEGKRQMITKVRVDNASSRRAVEKAGFQSIALMHFRRLGPRTKTTVEAREGDRARFLVETLSVGR